MSNVSDVFIVYQVDKGDKDSLLGVFDSLEECSAQIDWMWENLGYKKDPTEWHEVVQGVNCLYATKPGSAIAVPNDETYPYLKAIRAELNQIGLGRMS